MSKPSCFVASAGVLFIFNFIIFLYYVPTWRADQNLQEAPLANKETYGLRSMEGTNDDELFRMNPFHVEEFQKTNVNCSVRVMTDRDDLDSYLRNDRNRDARSLQDCTLSYFRRYLIRNRRYDGDGAWFIPPDGSTPSMDAEYYPNGCVFSKHLTSVKALHACFSERKLRSILVTGDSNSSQLKKAIDGFLKQLTGVARCEVLARSDGDPAYYVVPGVIREMIKITPQKNKRVSCSLQGNTNYTLERVAMMHSIDGSLGIKTDKILKGMFLNRVFYAETRLEYLLKYYFPHVGFPDLWFYYLPFHHECWGNTVSKIRADLSYMMDLMYIYLPASTTVLFISDARECPELRPPEVGKDFEGFWNTTRNECIHHMNQALFEILAEKAPRSANFYAFLDADKISCPIECVWHQDGAHMVMTYYAKMAEYMLESYCAETT